MGWTEIEGVRQDSDKITTFTVETRGGGRLTLGPTANGKDVLADLLRDDARTRRLPARIAALRAGQTVPFGRASLGPRGITVGSRSYMWSDVTSLMIKGDEIHILDGARPLGTITTSKVADLRTFLAAAGDAIRFSRSQG